MTRGNGMAVALIAMMVAAMVSSTSACCSGYTMDSLGLSLLKSSEGFSATTYTDATGNPTICWGHKIVSGQSYPQPMSEAACEALLMSDLTPFQNCVANAVNVPLNENQFSALVDFAYNLGCGSLESSTLLRDLNNNEYSAVPAQMMRWVYGGSVVLPGLVTRRRKEGVLWNTPVGGSSSGGAATSAPTSAPTAPAAQATTAASNVQTTAASYTTAAATAAAQVETTTGGYYFEDLASSSEEQNSGNSLSLTQISLIVAGCVSGILFISVGIVVRMRNKSRQEDVTMEVMEL